MNKKGKIFVIIIIFVLLFIIFTYLFNEVKILKNKIENLEKTDNALSERIQENTDKISNIQTQKENISSESRQLADSVFDCSPTDGLSPISEDEAKNVWEEFKKEYNIDEYTCNRNNENLDWVDGYVDIYTGKVIGGQFYGV